MRRITILSFISLSLLACGPLDDGELGFDDELAPIDEEGYLLNTLEGERRASAACPLGGNVEPGTPSFGASINGYASYVGQSGCSGSSKPGVTAFKSLVLAAYPCTSSGGIVRGCGVGGKSEHKEGRAWDWMVKAGHPAAKALLGWLLATDKHGNKHANARRLGIMYMIFDHKMWRAYKPSQGWQPYGGSNPHTDHVHFSFSWSGANKQTSFWSAPPAPSAPSAPSTPSTPPAPPQAPGHPRIGISTSIATILGQGRDFCQRGKSKGIFDVRRDQATTVDIDVKNTGTAVAKNVRVGIWTEEPYLRAIRWTIFTDWKAGGGFKINDTDGMQTIPRTDPGSSFALALAAISPGETKRVVLRVRATKASFGVVDHPDVRAWVSHVDNYYEKASFSGAYNNVKGLQQQNGGDLRHHSQTDVIGVEVCDQRDNDCDGVVDEGGVCSTPPPPPSPPSPAPPQQPDTGASPAPGGDSGSGGAPMASEADGMAPPQLPPAATPSPSSEVVGACAMSGPMGAASQPPAGLLLLGGLLLLALAFGRRGRRGAPREVPR